MTKRTPGCCFVRRRESEGEERPEGGRREEGEGEDRPEEERDALGRVRGARSRLPILSRGIPR